VERIAIEPPIKCFGLEQTLDNPLCPKCPHQPECASVMDYLARRESLDKATFSFLPDGLMDFRNADVNSVDPDVASMEEVYEFCHKWVFEDKAPANKIGINQFHLVLNRVREAETSVKLFFLCNMLAWQQANGKQPFYSKMLTGDAAVHQVKTFASVCRTRFGAFDTTTLDRLLGSDVARKDFDQILLSSEMTAGNWIIGYKMFKSGNVAQNLYADKETLLHPYWLAIEPTYYEHVLRGHVNHPDPNLSALIRKHRWTVVHIHGQLKRRQRKAVAVFHARERIMPEAIHRVLAQRGFQPDDFMIERSVVTDSIRFWSRLAVAIQQVELLKLVDGNTSVFTT